MNSPKKEINRSLTRRLVRNRQSCCVLLFFVLLAFHFYAIFEFFINTPLPSQTNHIIDTFGHGAVKSNDEDQFLTYSDKSVSPRANQKIKGAGLGIVEPDEDEDDEGWKGMKILCFMTTHLSETHIDALETCWPDSLKNVSMLRNSDLLIFANSGNDTLTEEILGNDSKLMKNVLSRFKTVKIKTQSEKEVNKTLDYLKQKQTGATLAMELAFANGWFDGYDWVYRVNPDVIIRDDKFLKRALSNDTNDGVFIECKSDWIHTDFFAVRPNVITPNSFAVKHWNAEGQAASEFRHILDRGRFMWLEGARPIYPGHCRVVGEDSPVVHDHNFIDAQCPSKFTFDSSPYEEDDDYEYYNVNDYEYSKDDESEDDS